MTIALYALDRIGVGHLVAAQDFRSNAVTGRCGCPSFTPKEPPNAHRPDVDAYCAGCLGWEERQAKLAEEIAKCA